jgi:hypothetical protein
VVATVAASLVNVLVSVISLAVAVVNDSEVASATVIFPPLVITGVNLTRLLTSSMSVVVAVVKFSVTASATVIFPPFTMTGVSAGLIPCELSITEYDNTLINKLLLVALALPELVVAVTTQVIVCHASAETVV